MRDMREKRAFVECCAASGRGRGRGRGICFVSASASASARPSVTQAHANVNDEGVRVFNRVVCTLAMLERLSN